MYKPLFPHLTVEGILQQGAVTPQFLSYAFRTPKVPVKIETFQTQMKTADGASGRKKQQTSHLKIEIVQGSK